MSILIHACNLLADAAICTIWEARLMDLVWHQHQRIQEVYGQIYMHHACHSAPSDKIYTLGEICSSCSLTSSPPPFVRLAILLLHVLPASHDSPTFVLRLCQIDLLFLHATSPPWHQTRQGFFFYLILFFFSVAFGFFVMHAHITTRRFEQEKQQQVHMSLLWNNKHVKQQMMSNPEPEFHHCAFKHHWSEPMSKSNPPKGMLSSSSCSKGPPPPYLGIYPTYYYILPPTYILPTTKPTA